MMGLPKRYVTCAACGLHALHRARGMCSRCYSVRPRALARGRYTKMIERCTRPDSDGWRWYGGRGIKVCDRWMASFDDYYKDVGDAPPGMSLDRVDNDGDYEPGNVRWATPKQQTENQRHAKRGTVACPQGHPYDEVNTYVTPRGRRDCRTCRRAAAARSHQKRASAAARLLTVAVFTAWFVVAHPGTFGGVS